MLCVCVCVRFFSSCSGDGYIHNPYSGRLGLCAAMCPMKQHTESNDTYNGPPKPFCTVRVSDEYTITLSSISPPYISRIHIVHVYKWFEWMMRPSPIAYSCPNNNWEINSRTNSITKASAPAMWCDVHRMNQTTNSQLIASHPIYKTKTKRFIYHRYMRSTQACVCIWLTDWLSVCLCISE